MSLPMSEAHHRRADVAGAVVMEWRGSELGVAAFVHFRLVKLIIEGGKSATHSWMAVVTTPLDLFIVR